VPHQEVEVSREILIAGRRGLPDVSERRETRAHGDRRGRVNRRRDSALCCRQFAKLERSHHLGRTGIDTWPRRDSEGSGHRVRKRSLRGKGGWRRVVALLHAVDRSGRLREIADLVERAPVIHHVLTQRGGGSRIDGTGWWSERGRQGHTRRRVTR